MDGIERGIPDDEETVWDEVGTSTGEEEADTDAARRAREDVRIDLDQRDVI
jgi:hypothetical protein